MRLPLFRLISIVALCIWLVGCSVYSFTQSALPSYFRTIDIPLFVNQSSQPDVADAITEKLTSSVLSSAGQLKLVRANADASIYGTVLSYASEEYQYDIKRERVADVGEYIVRITAKVEFLDNHKGEALYNGTLSGQGTYTKNETEELGRRKAVDDIVEQVLQNSIQSW